MAECSSATFLLWAVTSQIQGINLAGLRSFLYTLSRSTSCWLSPLCILQLINVISLLRQSLFLVLWWTFSPSKGNGVVSFYTLNFWSLFFFKSLFLSSSVSAEEISIIWRFRMIRLVTRAIKYNSNFNVLILIISTKFLFS